MKLRTENNLYLSIRYLNLIHYRSAGVSTWNVLSTNVVHWKHLTKGNNFNISQSHHCDHSHNHDIVS